MQESSFEATAWNNGGHSDTGAGYGLRIGALNRDTFFHRNWNDVTLYLQGNEKPVSVKLTPAFWKQCSEVRSKDIGRWLIQNGHALWEKGRPPRFRVKREGERDFYVAY